ncbi:MAG: hypothetical protein ABJC04_00795 [Verrucomicrobiota bacterium]
MDRLQKKCLMGAALLHGLLLLAAIISTAFFNQEEPISSARIIEIIPGATITDGKTGGGNPVPAGGGAQPTPPPASRLEPTPPAPEPERKPEPRVEAPKPKPVVKEVKPEIPEATQTFKPVKKTVTKTEIKPAPPKPSVDLGKMIVRNAADKKAANEAAEKIAQQAAERAAEKGRAQRLAALNKAVGNIKNNLSGATTIETGAGGSGGGAAEMNYADIVLSKYDKEWLAPSDVDDN